MAAVGKVIAKRFWGLSKEEFDGFKGTPEYRLLLKQQIGIVLDPSASLMEEKDFSRIMSRITLWCERNCSDNYYMQRNDKQRFLMFMNEDDMVNFKIFWDGMPFDTADLPNV